MKLADIKKLKVAELRSKLTELGLDCRGLKADLVDRLWCAFQSQQTAEHVKQLNDTLSTLSGPTEPDEVLVPQSEFSLPSVVECATKPCEVDQDRGYTDTATQTEPEPGPPAVPPGSVCPVDEKHVGLSGGSDSEETDRGRAFYEFKEEIRYKRCKSPHPPQDKEEEWDEDRVTLDPYGCHLHFKVGSDGSSGEPRFWDRFPLLWSGCRLTHGVQQGRAGFEVRLERKLLNVEQEANHGLRVGWSVGESSLLLGEDQLSFAYDRRGKKVSGGNEEEYGEPLSEGDIIGCYASFSADGAVELFFHKNSRSLGRAFSLSGSVLRGQVLVPHVLCQNCSVRLLLDPMAPQWYPGPPGFTALTALPAGQRERIAVAPTSKAQCEVVMMVGLPGSGKSFWARTLMKQHPEKNYRLLGTEELLTCMLSGGQTDSRLQQASQCLTDLIKVAAETPGNYILDQCNILFSARRHKLQLFAGFRRKVVVVFPPADEWKRRLLEHRMNDGVHIPETALLKLQVSCSFPEPQPDLMEELEYVELQQEEAKILLTEYKQEAHRLLPPVIKPDKKPKVYKRRRHFLCPPASNRMQWTALHGWGHPRSNLQLWSQPTRHWPMPYQQENYDYSRNVGYSGYPSYS